MRLWLVKELPFEILLLLLSLLLQMPKIRGRSTKAFMPRGVLTGLVKQLSEA